MELDAFTARLGADQGRVVDAAGEVRFILGAIDDGRYARLAPGDHVDVVQSLDVTQVALVRASFELRAPASLPAGLAWEASVVVDGTKRASLRCVTGRTRRSTDLAANVSKLTGLHDVGVRLELVTT